MNRKSATIKSVGAHKPELPCRPALMAARIAAVLMPPSPDMDSSFGSEPCISRRTSWRKDISVMSSVYTSTKRRRRPSGGTRSPNSANQFRQFRRCHSARRDGPVSSKTGNTTNGVVISARKKVPKKPIRRSIPQRPVRAQNVMYTVASSMGLGLARSSSITAVDGSTPKCRPYAGVA